MFGPNLVLHAQSRRAGAVLKAFCFCSSRQFVARGEGSAAGGGGGCSTLRLFDVCSNTGQRGSYSKLRLNRYTGKLHFWFSILQTSVSPRGIQGTSTAFRLAAGFPSPCTGSKNVLTCPFLPRTQFQNRVVWLSQPESQPCMVDGEGSNQLLQAETGLLA